MLPYLQPRFLCCLAASLGLGVNFTIRFRVELWNLRVLMFREEKTITHHAFFRKIFRKIGQKSKQQKTHISVAKCVRCFKDPERLRLARPISCIFSVGRVHHESLHGGVRKIFALHRKIASIFHRKMVCVFLSAAGKLVNIFHRKNFPFSSHVV